MGFMSWLKRKACKHYFATVWERDYEVHVLGEKPSPFRNLSGSPTVMVCVKCGATKPGPFIRTEEEIWADANIISHFPKDEACQAGDAS